MAVHFTNELHSTYIGPIEAIVNTINGRPVGRIDEQTAKQPNLLIATNFEEHALYAYLGSQFLNINAEGSYKFSDRPPDWIIPRANWSDDDYTHSFLARADYERIDTAFCDYPYQQTYLVRTHRFTSESTCDNTITLFRLN